MMYLVQRSIYIVHINKGCTMTTRSSAKLRGDIDIAKEAKAIRVRRLSKTLVDLVDLKVKGIITEKEFSQQKRKLLGF